MVTYGHFQHFFSVPKIDAFRESSKLNWSISLEKSLEDRKVDGPKCQISMRSSSFAEKEDRCGNLLHEKTDKMCIVFEESEKKVKIVLNKL